MTATRFALELDQEFGEALEEFETIIRTAALQGLTRIVQRTPVDTGRARGNCFVSIGAASGEVTEQVDPAGGQAIAAGNAVIASWGGAEAGFPVIFIQNNLPYIERLENGYSAQAPNGMLGVTVAELQVQFQ